MRRKDYIESHSTPADDVLNAIERWANLHTAQPQMLAGGYEGSLLTIFSSMLQPRCAVEVGSFVGYSTICIARGIPNGGVLHSFEINEEYESVIRRHLAKAGVAGRVELHIGDAGKLLDSIFPSGERRIDLAFVDAGKRDMMNHYEMLVPRMRRGGVVIVDNVLWSDKVLDTEQYHDIDTLSIDSFNAWVQRDERVENLMLDVRDGILVCRVL